MNQNAKLSSIEAIILRFGHDSTRILVLTKYSPHNLDGISHDDNSLPQHPVLP